MPSQIAPHLWQGSQPIEGDAVAKAGYRVLVLCADEYQPAMSRFIGLEDVIYAPNDDGFRPFSPLQKVTAQIAAGRVADYVRKGKNVLVTCMQGRNRSGLVSALTLHNLYGWGGTRCVHHVQSRRWNALTNDEFVQYLRTIPAKQFARTG
jgi:hypothetical protein